MRCYSSEMKISQTIEWATHICGVLAALPLNRTLSANSLAEFHELPPAYVAKMLQMLVKSKIIKSIKGKAGGYCLAKSPVEISLWDIRVALVGNKPMFRCSEIRRRGPCAVDRSVVSPCSIAKVHMEAEQAYENILNSKSLADILMVSLNENPDLSHSIVEWVNSNV